jgi:protein gp37
MADKSKIEWTEATWNPVTGCSKVSPGCAHCYAETLSLRFGWSQKPWLPEHAKENVVLHPDRLDQPLRWERPRMVFVNSMSDLFHEEIPYEYLVQIFDVMARAKHHTFQVLTKRPEVAQERLPMVYADLGQFDVLSRDVLPLPNVWLGVSIENARYTWRAHVLRDLPAAVRFISAEPLLGSLMQEHPKPEWPLCSCCGKRKVPRHWQHLTWCDECLEAANADPASADLGLWVSKRRPTQLDLREIDWLIVGGESGSSAARPMHPQWARELRDACLAEGQRRYERAATCAVPIECPHGYDVCPICDGRPAFFFKQWGSWVPLDEDAVPRRQAHLHTFADGTQAVFAGLAPKSGGKDLDGREWCEMPPAAGQLELVPA